MWWKHVFVLLDSKQLQLSNCGLGTVLKGVFLLTCLGQIFLGW